jgi:hypothetical protein
MDSQLGPALSQFAFYQSLCVNAVYVPVDATESQVILTQNVIGFGFIIGTL